MTRAPAWSYGIIAAGAVARKEGIEDDTVPRQAAQARLQHRHVQIFQKLEIDARAIGRQQPQDFVVHRLARFGEFIDHVEVARIGMQTQGQIQRVFHVGLFADPGEKLDTGQVAPR